MLISHAQLFIQLDDVELEETNGCCTSHSLHLVTCLPDGPPQLRVPCVHFKRLSCCIHRISRSLQLSFRLGVSTPTSPWSPSFPGWNHQLSGSHDGCGECGFHIVHIAVFRRVYPEVPSNSFGHLSSKLGISYQATRVYWWSSTCGFEQNNRRARRIRTQCCV